MNAQLVQEVKQDLEILGIKPASVYVDPARTITFLVDKLRLDQIDQLAFWFQTSRINFCQEEGMTSAGSANGYAVEIYGATLQ
jgi:hypothetical protein